MSESDEGKRYANMDPSKDDPTWNLVIPELSEEQARRILDFAYRELSLWGEAVDPKLFMSISLDRWTAERVRDALVSTRRSDGSDDNLIDAFTEWLAKAEP